MKYKFRAWDEQSKEMHNNFQWIDSGGEGNDWIIFRSDRQKLSSKPHPFENPYFRQQYHIMQFTGLHDKNGKEIYEGDIWKRGDYIATVDFEYSQWAFPKAESSGCYQYPSFHSNAITGEIIGNIHENPELLEVSIFNQPCAQLPSIDTIRKNINKLGGKQ